MAEEENFKILPIRWVIPDGLDSKFATNIVVQNQEEEFRLLFFEIKPPILIGSDDDKKRAIDEYKNVEAKCVAHVVVTPDRMKDFVKVLNNQLARYEESIDRRRSDKE